MYKKYEALLKERNVTTYQVCKETGISQSAISMWKHREGKNGKDITISLAVLKKIADYFSVPVDYFLGD